MKVSDRKRIFLLVLLLALLTLFFLFDLQRYFELQFLKTQLEQLQAYRQHSSWQAAGAFFVVYVLITGLSLPGAAVLGLAAGAIFGFVQGTVLVSFASTVGATVAFLAARYLARDVVNRRFAGRLEAVNRGIEKEGVFYLFALRLVPLFPFFIINLVMGLTVMRTWTYIWVSQLGMLLGTMTFVNAGTQLALVETPADVLSARILVAFAALGLLPLVAKRLLAWWRSRRLLARWVKPKRFDRNLVVIGAGAAGLVTSYVAASAKAKVTLVEKHRMGGDCLNTGCVPSKALIRAARYAADIRRAADFGIDVGAPAVDFPRVMQRVRQAVKGVEPHDSVERYTELGVECLSGEAKIVSPFEVEVDGNKLSTRNIVIATGARPFVPPIPGLESIDYLTSDSVWNLDQLPPRLLVLGGGPIGCELSQAFARLGSEVTLVEMMPRLLIREDPEVSDLLEQTLSEEGVKLRLGWKAANFGPGSVALERDGMSDTVPFDRVLVAVGRRANTEALGADRLGLELNPNGTLKVDGYMSTSVPGIFACGDVAGPYQLTHAAGHQAWYASMNALFGRFKRFRVDYSAMPHAVYTEPEIARVGINESEAKEKALDYEAVRFELADLDRAIVDGETAGFIKVLTPTGKDRILGATLVGHNAGDLVGIFTAAIKGKHGLSRILGTIQPYPTFAEAAKYTAGQWRKQHMPERLLKLSEVLHRHNRG